jgi:hypothetical protein
MGAPIKESFEGRRKYFRCQSKGLVISSGAALLRLCLISLLDPLIQRLQHPGVHSGNDINRCIQLFLSHSRFPCVRKAAFHSRITEAHHRDGEADEHLLAFAKTFDGVSIAIEGSKVGFLHILVPYQGLGVVEYWSTGVLGS